MILRRIRTEVEPVGDGGAGETGRFLILGSASRDVVQRAGESLAGRIAYRELTPLNVLEVGLSTHCSRSLTTMRFLATPSSGEVGRDS